MSAPLTPSQRIALIKHINALVLPDFETLLYALSVPPGIIPANSSAQGNRAIALLQWVNSPNGCGMDGFLTVLAQTAPLPAELKTLEQRSKQGDIGVGVALRPRLPALLTYDLDRSDQEFQLSQHIEKLGRLPPKPLICLIHGNDDECHDKFIDCLEKKGLHRLLGLTQNLAPYRIYIPKWPSQPNEQDHFHERYRKSLADSILQYSHASQEELNACLMAQPAPVIIELEFQARSWKKHAANVVLNVLDFWQQWPPLAPNQTLLVFLSIRYLSKQRPLSKVFGCKPIGEEISASLKSLPDTYSRQIMVAVLPTLEGVIRQDVEAWVRMKENELLLRFGEAVVDDLRETVRAMFEECQSKEEPKRISMKRVTKRLRQILQQHNPQRGAST